LPKNWEEIEKIDRVKLLMEKWISPSRHLHQYSETPGEKSSGVFVDCVLSLLEASGVHLIQK